MAGCLIHRALYDAFTIAGQTSAFDSPRDHLVSQLFCGCHDKIVRLQLQLLHQVGDRLWPKVAFGVVCHSRNLSDQLTLMTSATAELPDADIIVDEIPYSGIFNMSMDAALLQLAAERERSVVRIYQWSEPTVTLGYFQGSEQSLESPFPGLPVVRRLSGGGAILHDQEITYSLVLPASHPARQDPSAVYQMVHRAIIRLLSDSGVPCQLRSEFDAMNSSATVADTVITDTGTPAEPFLCFLRKNANDIVHVVRQ